MTSEQGFLERMAATSRERARLARQRESESSLLARVVKQPAAPALTLRSFDLIAEFKLRSPGDGQLGGSGFDRHQQLKAYASAGVACVSVLTEPDEFHGSLDHLRDAARILSPLGVPVMRKDFLCDPYQVLEARAAGASGILVIVTMLDDSEVRELLSMARNCGLFVLLEAFDANDLDRIDRLDLGVAGAGRAMDAKPEAQAPTSHPPVLAGVNCRNLKTLQVDFARFAQLANALPRGLPIVAESGLKAPGAARQVAELGYSVGLVGSALMRADNPENAATALIEAGRTGVGIYHTAEALKATGGQPPSTGGR